MRSVGSLLLVMLAPTLVISTTVAISAFQGSLSDFLKAALQDGLISVVWSNWPCFSLKSTGVFALWVLFQGILFRYLPGPIHDGQRSPAGHLLTYRTNGFNAWFVTHAFAAALCYFGILDPAFIPKNWGGLVLTMNAAGLLLSVLAFIKAHLRPTHADDRKFSGKPTVIVFFRGSIFYDFYMGIEHNPRLWGDFDLKLFTNGRPGIIAWTLIDLSNIAYQYEIHGRIDPNIVLVTILHAVYVLDFFVNESWYLRTIDIAHDHFGFYLAWGSFVWLPSMYTIQTQFLGLYPTRTSTFHQVIIFSIGVAGYIIFRAVNSQKDRVRRSNGDCSIWGNPAKVLVASYKTSDGQSHQSLLICSGWWGWSRHANYFGDLLLSTAMCALVGSSKCLIWFYAMFMTILLVHRCIRDEARCSAKYGPVWEDYCRTVPWRIVPGIW
ncbi:ergosterol biosynthesis ERG4/ERG24 family protein [Colletotrichum limetticola]|uniref:7-dehydrocholesterol reductase n=1 Tax=Colletotrichum limetticola TaxID=1209924 RepID=A0ABQ9PPI2_9PEZI|nr:ergosterol biosynthesis ERG4/ERG24 family protein [Colletotrichum limetticola]